MNVLQEPRHYGVYKPGGGGHTPHRLLDHVSNTARTYFAQTPRFHCFEYSLWGVRRQIHQHTAGQLLEQRSWRISDPIIAGDFEVVKAGMLHSTSLCSTHSQLDPHPLTRNCTYCIVCIHSEAMIKSSEEGHEVLHEPCSDISGDKDESMSHRIFNMHPKLAVGSNYHVSDNEAVLLGKREHPSSYWVLCNSQRDSVCPV